MRKVVLFFSISILSMHTYADEAYLPYVNEDTIKGIWEAVDDLSIYRLEIDEENNSYLCLVRSKGSWFPYKLDDIMLSEDGFSLFFTSTTIKRYTVEIIGIGYANMTKGLLDAVLYLKNRGEIANSWELDFVKTSDGDSYIDYLYALSLRAQEAIDTERSPE